MGRALIASTAYLPAPLNAAPVIPDYPQFECTTVPIGCNAVRAWTGIVQPFVNDDAARRFLHCVEVGKPFDVIEGSIDAHAPRSIGHWADPWIVNTDMRFRILVLEFEEPEHPQAYSLRPEISRQIHPLHPHLREDKLVFVNQRLIPALCIYSGADFKYSQEWPRIVQFLDQAIAYIGRHIIWLKTRIELPTRFGDAFRVPPPGEPIFDYQPIIQTDPNFLRHCKDTPLWLGYWPGPVALSGPSNHLRIIRPSQECWC